MYFQSMLNGKIYVQYGTSSAATLYDLSENLLDRSLVQAFVYKLLVVATQQAVFKGEGTLKKHNFSGTGFACYIKFCPTKNVLIDKIHVQSKVENIPTNVQSVS